MLGRKGDAGHEKEQAVLAETYFVVTSLALETSFPGFRVGPSRGHWRGLCSWLVALSGRAGCTV